MRVTDPVDPHSVDHAPFFARLPLYFRTRRFAALKQRRRHVCRLNTF